MRKWNNEVAVMTKVIGFAATVFLLLAGNSVVYADDTEIYSSQYLLGSGASGRPKVLIIFDNSGSMDTTVPSQPVAYDPAVTYPTVGSISSSRLYWSTGSNPPSSGTSQFFAAASNRCASSYTPLGAGGVGFYQDNLLRWRDPSGWWGDDDSDDDSDDSS